MSDSEKNNKSNAWSIILMGLFATPLLYGLAIILEFLACFCTGCGNGKYHFFGCNWFNCLRTSNGPYYNSGTLLTDLVWSSSGFWNIFLFLTGSGFIIGIVYVIGCITQERSEKQIKRNYEEAKRLAAQRQEYAAEFKTKSNSIESKCNSNIISGQKNVLSHKYECVSLQEKIWDATNDISLNLQKLENIAEEINAKESK